MNNEQITEIKTILEEIDKTNYDLTKVESLQNILENAVVKYLELKDGNAAKVLSLSVNSFKTKTAQNAINSLLGKMQEDITEALSSLKTVLEAVITTTEIPCTNSNHKPTDAPKDLVGVAPTTVDNNDGKITGLSSTLLYEYKGADIEGEFTNVNAKATEITGLKTGIYDVRIQAEGDKVASKVAKVTVPEYQPISK